MLPSGGPCRSSKLHECQCPFPSDSGSPETSRQRGPPPRTQSGIHLCRLQGGHGAAGHPPRGTGSWPGTDMGTGERPQRCPGSGERRMGAVLPRHPREIPHPSSPPQGTSVLREHIAGNPPPWEGAKVREAQGDQGKRVPDSNRACWVGWGCGSAEGAASIPTDPRTGPGVPGTRRPVALRLARGYRAPPPLAQVRGKWGLHLQPPRQSEGKVLRCQDPQAPAGTLEAILRGRARGGHVQPRVPPVSGHDLRHWCKEKTHCRGQ